MTATHNATALNLFVINDDERKSIPLVNISIWVDIPLMDTHQNTAESSAVRPSSEGRQARVRLGSDGRSFRIRSRASNDPKYIPKQPNLRAQDRRRRDLIAAFLAALGPDAVNDLTQVMVRRAAELTVAAEVVRAGMLTGNLQSDITGLIKLENAARRAVLALGIKVEKPRGGAGGLTIARARWEEQREKAKKAGEAATSKNTEPAPDDRAAK